MSNEKGQSLRGYLRTLGIVCLLAVNFWQLATNRFAEVQKASIDNLSSTIESQKQSIKLLEEKLNGLSHKFEKELAGISRGKSEAEYFWEQFERIKQERIKEGKPTRFESD